MLIIAFFRVFVLLNCSVKSQLTLQDTMQIEIFQPDLYFTPKWYNFKETPLGKVYQTIPWHELSQCLPLENDGPGAPRWFSNKGLLGVMFLKAYLDISDEKLVERFNTDWSLQLFCGKLLGDTEKIRDLSIVSRIRTYLAEHTDWQQLQKVLLNHWKKDMENTHMLLMDATCYESYIRYPTDIKLLWECCHWVFEKQLFHYCKLLGIKRPRSKYHDQKIKYLNYARRKGKSHKLNHKRKKALLYLLEKGVDQLQEVLDKAGFPLLNQQEREYLKTIKKVLLQHKWMIVNPGESIKDRIVSLPKPYVRPIVRGKENKRVEFGMKVHMLQVDGICFIDTMDFKAFNECKRLKVSTLKHKQLFGPLHQLGADKIYATNENRRYITSKDIFTCFPKKGPKTEPKEEKKLRSLISVQRATVMEGSFGTHKTAYGLAKVKAKGEKREKLWVFFGVMTANAVKISKNLSASPPSQKAA